VGIARDAAPLGRRWGDGAQGARLLRRGHSGAVVAVAFSPDGTRVLSGSRDGKMRLWITATGQPLLAIRPAGRSRDTATTVWDAATGRPLFTVPPSNDFSRTLGSAR
jgi:WD40 repeat protein